MIPRTAVLQHTPRWQQELARAIREPEELLRLLELGDRLTAASHPDALAFPLRVPRGFVARMTKGDPDDPLLRQVLPLDEEGRIQPGYRQDPLEEKSAMPVPGLLHKYRNRVLLTVTGACGVHCRYCFRRHFPYTGANPNAAHYEPALDYLDRHPEVDEVLLSGGDPLSLSDRRLAPLLEALGERRQLKRLRIHTRQPVVLPERVDEGLLSLLADSRLPVVMVIHANHGREIDQAVAVALGELRRTGVRLLNQSVLLKGVNDRAECQADLQETLFAAGVLPYYLHQLDPVQGAAHFAVPDREARALMTALQGMLPGYLVPRLVREEPGAQSKTPIPTGPGDQ